MAEKETPVDDQLELKKRARRRLVGAVALALAAVVILPMVMDSEPRPAGQDIQVRIPSQDAASNEIPRKVNGAATPPATPAAVTPSAVMPKPEMAVVAVPKVEAPVAAKPVEPIPESVKAADKPQEKVAEHAVDKAAAKRAEEARAAAALLGKTVAQPTSSSTGPWIVQLGAYQNAGNVKLLMSKLKEMGIATYTEKLESPQGPRTRVRAGPFPSREAAEKAQVRIRKIGVDGSVAPKQ